MGSALCLYGTAAQEVAMADSQVAQNVKHTEVSDGNWIDGGAARTVGDQAAKRRSSFAACEPLFASLGSAAIDCGDNSPLMSATLTSTMQCAPSSVQRICCLLAMRWLTPSLTADSAMLLAIGRPL